MSNQSLIIRVRSIVPNEFESYLDNWLRSEREHLTAIGTDHAFLPPKDLMLESLQLQQRRVGEVKSIKLIEVNNETIGSFLATNITDQSIVLHSMIWKKELRGKGVGTESYRLAMIEYFETYSVTYIDFYTPINNPAANAVKRKLKIPALGEKLYQMPLTGSKEMTNHYRVSRDEAKMLRDYRC